MPIRAATVLAARPSQLRDVLICRQRSYFSYIPTRFGSAVVLDDAFRCLITAAHAMLIPDHKPSSEKILSFYGRALRSLQSAVNDQHLRYSPDVLCATAILALFEVRYATRAKISTIAYLLPATKFTHGRSVGPAYRRSFALDPIQRAFQVHFGF